MRTTTFILLISPIVVLALTGIWLLFAAPENPGKSVWVLVAVIMIAPMILLGVLLIRKMLTGKDKTAARAIAAQTDCPHCRVRSLEWNGTSRSDVLYDDPDRQWFKFCCPRCTGLFEFNRCGFQYTFRADDLMSRFRGYTDRADKGIREAGALSKKRGDRSAGPEHLFLVLDPRGLGAAILASLDFPMEKLQQEFRSARRMEDRARGAFPPFSDKMLEVLAGARRIARSMGHNYVGHEHLLLALAKIDSPVSAFLRSKSLTFEAIREETLRRLGIDENSWTPLTRAVANGDAAEVESLLDGGADANERDASGATPLLWAASCGEREIAEVLIAHGADVNATDRYGFAPLHRAASDGNRDVVELLIAKGVDLNAGDHFGATALQLAGRFHPEAAEALRKAGAKEGPSGEQERREREQAEAGGIPDYPVDERLKWTPLHWAAYRGHADIVERLVAKGADVNAKDAGGETPLLLAACKGETEVVEVLVANGADVNAKDDGQYTPLYWAAFWGHKEIVEFLIAKGADINVEQTHGCTPLHGAAYNGKQEVAEVLVARGANTKVRNRDGRTALQLAIDNQRDAVEEVLCKAGAKE